MAYLKGRLRALGAAAVVPAAIALVVALLLSSAADSQRDRAVTMLEAARRGDAAEVEAALASGVPADALEAGSGFTALMHAARLGREDLANVLLERGANVDAMARGSGTPLMLAARKGSLVTMRL